ARADPRLATPLGVASSKHGSVVAGPQPYRDQRDTRSRQNSLSRPTDAQSTADSHPSEPYSPRSSPDALTRLRAERGRHRARARHLAQVHEKRDSSLQSLRLFTCNVSKILGVRPSPETQA